VLLDKINPYLLPRPERPCEEHVFAAGDVKIPFAVRAPDAADMNMIHEVSRRLSLDYITGRPEEGLPPAEFFDAIKVSEGLFMLAAAGQELQPPDKKRYNAEELIVLWDRFPEAGIEMAQTINRHLVCWRTSRGNSLGVPTEPSSVAHSDSTANTSKSPSAAIISSAA